MIKRNKRTVLFICVLLLPHLFTSCKSIDSSTISTEGDFPTSSSSTSTDASTGNSLYFDCNTLPEGWYEEGVEKVHTAIDNYNFPEAELVEEIDAREGEKATSLEPTVHVPPNNYLVIRGTLMTGPAKIEIYDKHGVLISEKGALLSDEKYCLKELPEGDYRVVVSRNGDVEHIKCRLNIYLELATPSFEMPTITNKSNYAFFNNTNEKLICLGNGEKTKRNIALDGKLYKLYRRRKYSGTLLRRCKPSITVSKRNGTCGHQSAQCCDA